MTFRDSRRRAVSTIMTSLSVAAVLIALVPLVMILFFVVTKGIAALNWDFFTQMPKPTGETGGGMANAIYGSLTVCAIGALFAIPVGIMTGVYVAEYAGTRFAAIARFASGLSLASAGRSAPAAGNG